MSGSIIKVEVGPTKIFDGVRRDSQRIMPPIYADRSVHNIEWAKRQAEMGAWADVIEPAPAPKAV